MPRFPGPDEFGNAIPNVQTRPVNVQGTVSEWIAARDLGDTINQIAANEIRLHRSMKFQNAIFEHELEAQRKADIIRNEVTSGELDYEKSIEKYRNAMSKAVPEDPGLPGPMLDHLNRLRRAQVESQVQSLETFAMRMGLESAKAEFQRGLTNLEKLAAYPEWGDNLQQLHVIADEELAKSAVEGGLPESFVQKHLEKYKENSWTQHAKNRLIKSSGDLQGLNALHDDLINDDGLYTGKLSIDRINGLLASVTNQITRAEYQAVQIEKKIDSASQKVLEDIEKQISTGVPAKPEMWSSWADIVQGSKYEDDFDRLALVEAQVQQILAKPIQEQEDFLRERETLLMSGGGDLKDIQNFKRIRSVIQSNIKQLQNEPLIFSQARSGQQVPPLQLEGILDNDLRPLIAAQIDDRITTIRALQDQYGTQVKNRPLLPQEASLLSSVLEEATPRRQGEVLSALRKAMNDDGAYMATMQQISPDAPVKALAGMLMAKERNLLLEKKWFTDDVSVTSGNVGQTLLVGESILNKTKSQKAADGSGKPFPVPPQMDFDASFASAVGEAFAGRPDAYHFAMQGVRAYYVGKSAQEGDISGVVDTSRMKRSVRAVLGNVVDLNGNGHVFAPWGMDPSEFEDRAAEAFSQEMQSRGMGSLADKFELFGLKNHSGDRYYVLQGRNYLLDNDKAPVIISVPGGDL